MVSSVSLNQTNYYQLEQPPQKNKNTGKKIAGVLAGGAVYNIVPRFQAPFAMKCLDKMQTLNNNLTKYEADTVLNALKKTMSLSGLTKKGIEIVKASENNGSFVEELLRKEMNNNLLTKLTPKKFIDKQIAGAKNMLTEGYNACYLAKSQKILIPDANKLNLAGFHEAGHAMNANLGKATKLLQKSRQLSALALPLIAIALLKKPKVEGEKPQGVLDKVTTFIKDHVGVLTAATFIPTIAEEGLATLRGNKFAKELLSPNLAKKVAKSNGYGFATYVVTAAAFGAAAYLAVKVKNAIAHPENSSNAKNQTC